MALTSKVYKKKKIKNKKNKLIIIYKMKWNEINSFYLKKKLKKL